MICCKYLKDFRRIWWVGGGQRAKWSNQWMSLSENRNEHTKPNAYMKIVEHILVPPMHIWGLGSHILVHFRKITPTSSPSHHLSLEKYAAASPPGHLHHLMQALQVEKYTAASSFSYTYPHITSSQADKYHAVGLRWASSKGNSRRYFSEIL